jgi:SAM-dependent methyltransferase
LTNRNRTTSDHAAEYWVRQAPGGVSGKAIIKIDLQQVLNGHEPVIIELGCGLRKSCAGSIGIDISDLPTVDIVADLENGLPFLPDKSVDQIHCRSFLEHIRNFELLMSEIVRVLKSTGTANIFVPHFSNPYYYSDPTHIRPFGLYSFYYFVDTRNQLGRKVPNFYAKTRIRIISKRLVFRSPFKLVNPIKKFLGWFINLNSWLQEYYEGNLCFILPCEGIELVFAAGEAERP